MKIVRHRLVPAVLATTLIALFSASPVDAQPVQPQYVQPMRIEITPLFGYLMGGGFDTDAFGDIEAGQLELADNAAWGINAAFRTSQSSWVELLYFRQDTDLNFNPLGSGSTNFLSGFATNYIHLGSRAEFGTGRIHPFLGGSLGATIFDVKHEDIGSSTRFSLSILAGANMMFGEQQRFGLRLSGRWWGTFVPSGDYGQWCDPFGCYVAEGTATVSQWEITGGLVIRFPGR